MTHQLFVFILVFLIVCAVEDQKFCSKQICEVIEKLESDSYATKQFQTNLNTFAMENNLESGHKALKKVLENLGKIVQIEKHMPLNSYLIQYQKILHEEAEFKLINLFEDESLHMAQLISDSEITWTKNLEKLITNITQGFMDAEISRSNKQDNQVRNYELNFAELNQKINEAEFKQLTKKVDNILNNSHLIVERLNQSISKVENINTTQRLDNKIVKLKNQIVVSEKTMSRNLEEYIQKAAIVTGDLNQAITDYYLNLSITLDNINIKLTEEIVNLKLKCLNEDSKLSKKLTDIVTKMEKKCDDKILNLRREFDTEIMKSRNMSEEIKIIKKENRRYHNPPSDCLDLQIAGRNISGVYSIYLKDLEFQVFCDMETDGGGWTVFLNRQKQTTQENFKRNWQEYKNGFGTPPYEFWMGNEALHIMTTSKLYSMRADAVGNGSPSIIWGEWSTFTVDSEAQKYQLTISDNNGKGTMYDAIGLKYNNGYYFSTFDRDNDPDNAHCAKDDGQYRGRGGGYWYGHCSQTFPTKPYGKILFHRWSESDKTFNRYASSLQMKLRPRK